MNNANTPDRREAMNEEDITASPLETVIGALLGNLQAAVEDHPAGATDEDLVQFAVDQLDCSLATDEMLDWAGGNQGLAVAHGLLNGLRVVDGAR